MDRCLTGDELTSLLVDDELGDERARLLAHLDGCPACRMVLAESAQHLAEVRDSTRRSTWVLVALVVAALVLVLVFLWGLRAFTVVVACW